MLKGKNKILLIISALIIFAGMFVFAQKLQKSFNNTIAEKATITAEQENKEDSKNDKINKEVSDKETSTDKTDNKEDSKVNESNKETDDKENVVVNDLSKVKDNSDSNTEKKSNANSYNSKNSSTEKKKTASKKEESSNSSNSSKATVEPKKEEPTPAVKDETPNFIVIDTISNKTLASKYVDYDNITVAQLTFKVLDELGIKYRTTGFNDTTYFASIAGIREKAAGPLSGWCYYVKKSGSNGFVKPNVGTGSWIYNKGDTVIWKYWEDGVNN